MTGSIRRPFLSLAAWAGMGLLSSFGELAHFGVVTLDPAFALNGAGSNVDSIAFWEAPDPRETLMFVTGKSNDVVEVWKFPFLDNEQPAISFSGDVNGVAVDQENDLLYVSDRQVRVLDIPALELQGEFGSGIIGEGENNLDLLVDGEGRTVVYVSDDHNIYRFDAATNDLLGSFAPSVSSIETVLADDFYQRIYVPEEQGPAGVPGVFAYQPDGTPYLQEGTNRFGDAGEFDSDEEGIILYTFPSSGVGDHGTGFMVVSDQRDDITEFEFFDRRTWAHLGTVRLTGVRNTDGIASTQKPLPDYPMGLFAAIDDDSTTVLVGWHSILDAIATPYEIWALDRGLVPGVDAGPGEDPDHDGRGNLEEFALDGNPLKASGDGKERLEVEEIGGAAYLVWTFPVREGARFESGLALAAAADGVVYSLAASSDMRAFGSEVEELAPARSAGLPPVGSGWEYRSFRLRGSVEDRGFLRRVITEAE